MNKRNKNGQNLCIQEKRLIGEHKDSVYCGGLFLKVAQMYSFITWEHGECDRDVYGTQLSSIQEVAETGQICVPPLCHFHGWNIFKTCFKLYIYENVFTDQQPDSLETPNSSVFVHKCCCHHVKVVSGFSFVCSAVPADQRAMMLST